MKEKLPSLLILLGIVLLGSFLRLYNLNWDQGYHLHPDERFLTMVGNSMKEPTSLVQYLNQATSPFNPANIGFAFYVYGMLPLILNFLLASLTGTNNYTAFTIQGRLLSAFLDIFAILLVFKTALLFQKKYKLDTNIKYWAAFFYAIAVLPIQLSHFFTVDTFLNFFLFASFYASVAFAFKKKMHYFFLSAIFLGCAFACKVTAFFILPVLLFFLTTFLWKEKHHGKPLQRFWKSCMLMGCYFLICYITLRFTDPYLFASQYFYDPRPSELFLTNLKTLSYWGSKDAWFPPGVQWINKTPVLFSLQNLAIFGLGIPYLFFAICGMWKGISWRKHALGLFVIVVWLLCFLFYQSTRTTQTMRYFLILYPFLAIFAGIGFQTITKQWNMYLKAIVLLIILFWPMLFFSIYTKNHSRVTATEWVRANIPAGKVILTEHWDDGIPLGGTEPYIGEQLPVFDPDSADKWQKMDAMLERGDYIILTSNRGWGSIPTVPKRYPQMKAFYEELFAGQRGYTEIKEFTSYPSLRYLGIPLDFPDQWSEEAFTVYDHPKVMIFKKQ